MTAYKILAGYQELAGITVVREGGWTLTVVSEGVQQSCARKGGLAPKLR